jgi:integrase
MGRKSKHGLPPGIHLDKHGVYWATLAGAAAKRWHEQFTGRPPLREASSYEVALKLQGQLEGDILAGRDPRAKKVTGGQENNSQQEPRPADDPLVAARVRTWIDGKINLAPTTRKRYDGLLVYQIEALPISKLRRSEVDHNQAVAHRDALRVLPRRDDPKRPISSRTIIHTFRLLHAVFETDVKSGVLTRNPFDGVELPRGDEVEMLFLTREQVEVFFALLDTYNNGKPHRNRALYHMAIRCGLRKGEIIGLRWKDVDLEQGVVRVLTQLQEGKRSGTKWRSTRTVILEQDHKAILLSHKAYQATEKQAHGKDWNSDALVFCSQNGTPINQSNLSRQFDSLLQHAGLPDIPFQGLRHTYVTLSLAATRDLYAVSKRVGHKSITTTANKYGHLDPGRRDDAELLGRYLRGEL